MAAVTQVTDLYLGQVTTATNAVMRVAQKYTASNTTLVVNFEPLDQSGAVITKPFHIGIKRSDGYVETMLVTSYTGTTLTVVPGISRDGLDYNTEQAGNSVDHEQGEEIVTNISAFILQQYLSVLLNEIGTGAQRFKIGDTTTDATQGFEIDQGLLSSTTKYGADASGNPLITLPDGSSFIPGAGSGVITGGDGIDVTASVISILLAATNDLLKFTSGELDTNLTATKTEIDQLSGTTNIQEANTFFGATDITGAQAETLSDGSNANSLHRHLITFGSETKNVAAGSDSQNIVHNLGTTPNWIKIEAFLGNGSGASIYSTHSSGAYDSSNYHTAYAGIENDSYSSGEDTNNIIRVRNSIGIVTATVVLTSTEIQLSYTNTGGAASGAMRFKWEVGV